MLVMFLTNLRGLLSTRSLRVHVPTQALLKSVLRLQQPLPRGRSQIVINKDIISLENINIFIGETQPTG